MHRGEAHHTTISAFRMLVSVIIQLQTAPKSLQLKCLVGAAARPAGTKSAVVGQGPLNGLQACAPRQAGSLQMPFVFSGTCLHP